MLFPVQLFSQQGGSVSASILSRKKLSAASTEAEGSQFQVY